jgi:hypothetical protein
MQCFKSCSNKYLFSYEGKACKIKIRFVMPPLQNSPLSSNTFQSTDSFAPASACYREAHFSLALGIVTIEYDFYSCHVIFYGLKKRTLVSAITFC